MNRDPDQHRGRDQDKDEALLALLAAAEDPRAAFEASPLASDPYVRARFEVVFGMAGELDALGAHERTSLMRALELELESGAAEAALRGAVQDETAEALSGNWRGVLRGPWRFVLLAAAVVALFAVPFLVGRGTDGDDGIGRRTVMGDATGLSPQGPVEAVELFRWKGSAGSGGYWRVVVYDKETRDEILSSNDLRQTEWKPSPAQLALLNDGRRPRSFIWKVSFHDDSGGEPIPDWQEFELL